MFYKQVKTYCLSAFLITLDLSGRKSHRDIWMDFQR